jgi:ATP-binding cassette subfamily F protein 3
VVTHDRYFIDNICNVTYEMEQGKLTRYGGNYSFFQLTKKQALEQESKLYKNQQEEIKRLVVLIEKFRYKKNKAAFAQSKIKYLARMDKIELTNSDESTFKANFKVKVQGGKSVCVLNDFEIGYNQPLAKLSLSITKHQRIGILGSNGCGKSTLVKSIAGKIPQLSGNLVLGHQISLGYFDQDLAMIDNENTVIEELWNDYPDLNRTEIRTMLGRFLFSGDDVFKDTKVLSGGERVRLAFAKLLLKHDNFLILDEPTNHLDILSKEALEDALLSYDGTLLFVSHDRYFIDRIADSLLVYEDNNFVYYPITYKEYLQKTKPKEVAKPQAIKLENPKVVNVEKTLSKLEKQITKAEMKLNDLQALLYLEEYYSDFLKQRALQKEIDEADDALQSLLRQWEQLQ